MLIRNNTSKVFHFTSVFNRIFMNILREYSYFSVNNFCRIHHFSFIFMSETGNLFLCHRAHSVSNFTIVFVGSRRERIHPCRVKFTIVLPETVGRGFIRAVSNFAIVFAGSRRARIHPCRVKFHNRFAGNRRARIYPCRAKFTIVLPEAVGHGFIRAVSNFTIVFAGRR